MRWWCVTKICLEALAVRACSWAFVKEWSRNWQPDSKDQCVLALAFNQLDDFQGNWG